MNYTDCFKILSAFAMIFVLLFSGLSTLYPAIVYANTTEDATSFTEPFVSTVANVDNAISPTSTDFSEGEKRIVSIGDVFFVFYYDGTHVLYKTSDNKDKVSWSAEKPTGVTNLSSDAWRLGITTTTTSDGKNRLVLLYSVASADNTVSNFYAKRGTVLLNQIEWDNPTLLFTVANIPECQTSYGGGVCGAAVASPDSNGSIFSAIRWGTSTNYHYTILKSNDGGLTWSISIPDTDMGDSSRNTMALTSLSSGKMLFVNALDKSTEFFYRIFDGTSWNTGQYTEGAGLPPTTGVKQISAASDNNHFGYVAFIRGANPGMLELAKWNNNTGTFDSFETIDSTLPHALPSMAISSTTGDIHIFTLSGGKIYDTKRTVNGWQAPTNPFGTNLVSPDQLTSGVSGLDVLWSEGDLPHISLHFGNLGNPAESSHPTTLALDPLSNVPWGTAISVTGKLTDNATGGVGIGGQIITFTTSAGTILNTFTTPNGTFSTTGTAPVGSPTGVSVQAHFATTQSFTASDSVVRSYNTLKHSTILVHLDPAPNKLSYLRPIYFTSILYDASIGAPLVSKTITWNGSGITGTPTNVTSAYGIATLTANSKNPPATYNVQSRYSGDSLYNAATSNVVKYISQRHDTKVLLWIPFNHTKGFAQAPFGATLMDTSFNGGYIVGQTITFNGTGVPGVLSKVTNANGDAQTFGNVPSTAGTWTVQGRFAGNSNYVQSNSIIKTYKTS